MTKKRIMNIFQRAFAWQQFRFQLTMIICAVFVIVKQRKVILNTLKSWWNWGFGDWSQERINFMIMLVVGIITFGLSLLANKQWKEGIIKEQQQEVIDKMSEEKVITREKKEELEKALRESV